MTPSLLRTSHAWRSTERNTSKKKVMSQQEIDSEGEEGSEEGALAIVERVG
jgi:hypothetical protein